MNWDDVRIFLAVARAGQILGAAKRLELNHATVSRRIAALEDALRTPLGYAQGNGAESLRGAIASFYPGASAANVCVTTGTSEANFLALTALVEAGDRIVVVLPTYMQVHGWATALGAEVVPLWLREDRGWQFAHPPSHLGNGPLTELGGTGFGSILVRHTYSKSNYKAMLH